MKVQLAGQMALLVLLAGCAPTITTETGKQEKEKTLTPAEELLNRSIAYHDPNGLWVTRPLEFKLLSSRSGGRRDKISIQMDSILGFFRCRMERGSDVIEFESRGGDWSAKVNGSADISAGDLEKYRLTRDGGLFWRNYYGFLLGLPMKLEDEGAILDPEPQSTTFQGREVLALRVTYAPAVGGDTWYFYLDPESSALVGYRFYHDESINDGEYITLEGEAEAGGLRLPKVRSWYVNKDNKFLGTDTIESIAVGEPKKPG